MINGLRNKLKTDDWLKESFSTLSQIAKAVSVHDNENEARELVIRALEYRALLSDTELPILNALVVRTGLYPYIDSSLLSTRDIIAYEFHRPYNLDEDDIVFHSSQAAVYRELLAGKNVILSAPTSYGKSLIIDSIIALNKFKNIAIIVPTIALIDETRQRLLKFRNDYKIITHHEQKRSDKNIFIMTQERALSYSELKPIDFFVIDEFYKLNSEEDKERALLLNKLFYELNKEHAQFYLLGPNIKSVPDNIAGELQYIFIKTDFSTVVCETKIIQPIPSAEEAVYTICTSLNSPTLIYCKSPASARALASHLLKNELNAPVPELNGIIKWLSDNYHPDWLLVKLLKAGIGIHHGKLPRAVAQMITKLFNKGYIQYLLCTTTLTEGVNTSAKNVIVYDNKIARRKMDYFTFNNIKGRSGRMFKHFIGRVFILDTEPQLELPEVDFPIFTQPDVAPDELLIQLDFDDLTDNSKSKIRHLYKQHVLDVAIIKENIAIPPENQIKLANELMQAPTEYHKHLSWHHYPSFEELSFASEIIWDYLGGDK